MVKNEERAGTFCVFLMYEICDPINSFITSDSEQFSLNDNFVNIFLHSNIYIFIFCFVMKPLFDYGLIDI